MAPRYELAAVKAAKIRIGRTVVEKANHALDTDQQQFVRKHITKLVKRLQPGDFVEVTHFGRPVIVADVYAKRDEYCLWYVKFHLVDGEIVVNSCHPAEHDITLASGKLLRKASTQ